MLGIDGKWKSNYDNSFTTGSVKQIMSLELSHHLVKNAEKSKERKVRKKEMIRERKKKKDNY